MGDQQGIINWVVADREVLAEDHMSPMVYKNEH